MIILQVKESHNRTVIASKHARPDLVVHHLADNPLGHENVVEPPTDILRPCIRHVRPERVSVLFLRVEVPERVHKLAAL